MTLAARTLTSRIAGLPRLNRLREFIELIVTTAAYDCVRRRRYRRPVEAPTEYRAYAQALRSDGYVLIPDYRPASVCREWARHLQEVVPDPPPPAHDDRADYRVYEGSRKIDLPSGGVVEWRNLDGVDGQDHGITCIYHVDREFPEFAELRSDPLVSSIIAAACGRELPSRAFKCFINASAGQTSGYHVDQTAADQFKSFLFLTDVTDALDGAHSYVPGTHRPHPLRYVNYLANFVARRYPYAMVHRGARRPVHLLCPAGTLAIVDITGTHRARPQAEGRIRVVLNNCFDDFAYD
jgi:hypothetical protein